MSTVIICTCRKTRLRWPDWGRETEGTCSTPGTEQKYTRCGGKSWRKGTIRKTQAYMTT